MLKLTEQSSPVPPFNPRRSARLQRTHNRGSSDASSDSSISMSLESEESANPASAAAPTRAERSPSPINTMPPSSPNTVPTILPTTSMPSIGTDFPIQTTNNLTPTSPLTVTPARRPLQSLELVADDQLQRVVRQRLEATAIGNTSTSGPPSPDEFPEGRLITADRETVINPPIPVARKYHTPDQSMI